MDNLKQLLFEGNINRKKPFSLSSGDPYMYYWNTLDQSNNPDGGVWMAKKKNSTAGDEPWFDLKSTLTPSQYQQAAKKLWANPLPNTVYQLDWSGEGDYSDINAADAAQAKKNTDALNKRLKSYNNDFAGSSNSALKNTNLDKKKTPEKKQSDSLTAASAEDKQINLQIQAIVRDLYKVTTGAPELYFRRFKSFANDKEQEAVKHFNKIWNDAWSVKLKELYAKASGFDKYNIKLIKTAQQYIAYKLINAGYSGRYNAEFYYVKQNNYVKYPMKFRWDYM